MNDTDQPTTLGSGTVRALESAWADIRALNPDVAEHVVFRIGSGRAGKRAGLTLGSITVNTDWEQSRPTTSRAKSDPARYHCIFIAGETLAQHPARLLETLIHEAAHSVAQTRKVKDVSRQNRYHNKRFRAIAEEMGLEWTHLQYKTDKDGVTTPNPRFDPNEPRSLRKNPEWVTQPATADDVLGFSDMSITKATVTAYRDTLKNLDSNVSVRLAAEAVPYRAPKRRRQVVVFATIHGPGLVSPEEAYGFLGIDTDMDPEVRAELNPQILGVVVYNGLAARDLLAPHVAWIEEV